ncbi:MAG: glycosyltransferase family 4 protein [Lentisphaeria bacterium]|nr:glycosyltransferase family 4 protein [Lentisphaeria bacterium]
MKNRRPLKLLIGGNGNLTVRDGALFVHHEIAAFLSETLSLGLNTEYATIVRDAGSEQVKNLADEKLPEGIRVNRFRSLAGMPRWIRPFAMLKTVMRLMFLVTRYDFVYCYYPGSLVKLIAFFCRLFHRPYGLNVRGEVPPTGLNRNTLKSARFILADGVCNVTRVAPEYDKCREIVPMCSIFQEDIPPVVREPAGGALHGLFVGRVEKNKGVFELFEALTVLKRRGIPVTMTLVGAYGADIEEAVKRPEISDMVTLVGLAKTPDELKNFYRDADFFCLPSYTEGFPRVLYEAMAYGLPCLTTLVGGIPSRMHAGENCLALKVRDVDSIVDAISALSSDSALAERLSQASLDTFACWKRRFSGSSHAIQLKDSITAALEGRICH